MRPFLAVRIASVILISSLFVACSSPRRKAEEYYQAGVSAKDRGEFQQALQQFQRAIAANPQHGNAYIEIGALLCRDRKYPEALKQLLRAGEYGASSYQLYAYMGYAYEQLGQLPFAERAYRQAISRSPEVIDVRLRLADLLEAQDKRREAADVLREVLTLKPDLENAAIISARATLLRQSQTPDIHRALANVYVSHGEIAKGMAEYRQAESLDPQKPETLARFGIFCAERGQLQIAQSYLERALEFGVANQPEVLVALGQIDKQLGKLPDAIAEYQAALQLKPDLHDVRLKLADLLEQVGQKTEAAALLEKRFYDGQAPDVNALWSRILRLRGEDSTKAVVQLKRSGPYHLIDVLVNDQAPATMIVDPRIEYAIISEKLVQRLNIVLSTKTSDVQFEFYGRRVTAPLINLPSLKVGDLQVQNMSTLIVDLAWIPGVDGVLGMNFLKYFQVEMKPAEQLFVLTKNKLQG